MTFPAMGTSAYQLEVGACNDNQTGRGRFARPVAGAPAPGPSGNMHHACRPRRGVPMSVPTEISDYVTAIDHVGLAVTDLDVAVDFYARAFGMEKIHEEINEEQG
ncbi:MAG: VOC family protein, partial [Candidatus Nanopelagicales bacterium]